MTQNQISYVRYLEDKRHNLATEAVSMGALSETIRSNKANETIKWAQVNEDIRSNQAKEAETHRANVAKELETNRANVAKETETHAYNTAYLSELMRSNMAKEAETERHQKVVESETARHNAMEDFLKTLETKPTVAGGLLAAGLAFSGTYNAIGDYSSISKALGGATPSGKVDKAVQENQQIFQEQKDNALKLIDEGWDSVGTYVQQYGPLPKEYWEATPQVESGIPFLVPETSYKLKTVKEGITR